MRKISNEELISLRDKGKVKATDAMRALERPKADKKVEQRKEGKRSEESKKIQEPKTDESLEKLTKVSINTTLALMNKLDKLIDKQGEQSYTVEKTGPLNTQWKMTVTRDAEKLISTIDVVAL